MTRLIALDTETTGLSPKDNHRIVEIACVELENLLPTGRELHLYINPQRDMPADAFRIHGLSSEFLRNHPTFSEHAAAILDFLQNDALVIHNAPFDMKFLDFEFNKIGHKGFAQHNVIDTLKLARKKFPGSPASLDALCKRFDISLDERTKHGALIDTRLLARVYLEMCGGYEPQFTFDKTEQKKNINIDNNQSIHKKFKRHNNDLCPPPLSIDDKQRHSHYVQSCITNSIWKLEP